MSARWDGGFGVVWHWEITFSGCASVSSASAQGSLPFSVSGPRPHPIALSPVGNLSRAVENVLSVLLFYPEDEAAKKALNQYQAQLGEPRPGLGPREVTPCSILTLGGNPKSSIPVESPGLCLPV